MTSMDLPKSTSSPGSAGGRTPPASPDGPMTDLFGQALAPASRSRSRAKGPDLLMQGICGPTFTDSSVPDGPLSSWESRLRERLAMVGSTESPLIWRLKTTPAGMSISRLAPWTPPTSVNEATGSLWPTPRVADSRTASWGWVGGKKVLYLNGQMREPASWPTVTTMDGMDRKGMRPSRAATGRTGGYITEFIAEMPNAETALWPTPKASTAGETSRSGDRKDEPLMGGLMRGVGTLATWVTPSARDWKDSAGMATQAGDRTRLDQLPRQMVHSGQTPTGSLATTAKRGAPNPAFPCWLMGYPAEWLLGAVSATQSIRSSRRK